MTTGELLTKDLPGSINREGDIVSALISNDKESGAIETAMNKWIKFAEFYTDTSNVYEQTDDMLDKTISFLSYLERFFNESDDSFKNRFRAIFYRNGDTSWGNPYDVKNVFREYFTTGQIYLLENTNDVDDTLLDDGDFVDGSTYWTLSGDAEITSDARFSKHNGASLKSGGSVAQTQTLDNDYCYFLHWFMKGNLSIQIYNSTKSLYWNNETKKWQSSEYSCSFSHDDWINESLYFSLKDYSSGTSNIQIKFIGGTAYFDYCLLFQKQKYCSFTVIIHYVGEVATEALALAEGTVDNPDKNIPPNVKVKAENWGYYGQTYITGPQSGYAMDVYQELLDYVRSCGVKAYLEFVIKDFIDE